MVGSKLPFAPLPEVQTMRSTALSQSGYKCTKDLEVTQTFGNKNLKNAWWTGRRS